MVASSIWYSLTLWFMAPLLAEVSLISVATESAIADTMEFTDTILTSSKKIRVKQILLGSFLWSRF